MIESSVMEDRALRDLAERLTSVRGVVGVVLGGSRARGTHRADSDIDIGVYYRGELAVADLQALAEREADEPVELTAPGGWGPWVDGGGWLTVAGWRVDWIYRDLDRVHRAWNDCRAGRYQVGFQTGHPLGFYSYAYAGEVALCRILADPDGELARLRARTRQYPAALGDALVNGLWEADFAVRLAGYGAAGADAAYTAGCLFRAVGVACHALHGRARRWLINEKGMVASAGALSVAPPGFTDRAQSLLGGVGTTRPQLSRAVSGARVLVEAVRAAIESHADRNE